jgi:hypothetical protein
MSEASVNASTSSHGSNQAELVLDDFEAQLSEHGGVEIGVFNAGVRQGTFRLAIEEALNRAGQLISAATQAIEIKNQQYARTHLIALGWTDAYAQTALRDLEPTAGTDR